MKLLHLSDLHLGKRVHEYSMLEDQKYILEQILSIVEREQPQGVLLAGDIYDKPIAPIEAVELLDWFLVELVRRDTRVFVISGNHDSPERLAFGGRLMESRGVCLAPVYDGRVDPIALEDEHGPVMLYMLPFVKPAHVRRFFPEAEITSFTDAMAACVAQMNVDTGVRNVLMTHQFVVGAGRSDSEEISVGGTDSVDGSVFDCFDYVALGHIHGPQNMGSPRIRYCGTPLAYSFSEADQEKSVTVVELGGKGERNIRTIPLTPRRALVELKGSFRALTEEKIYLGTAYPQSYLHITLTDEEDIPDALGRLRRIYPYIMVLSFDNRRTRAVGVLGEPDREEKSPFDLFSEFYEVQNNAPMTRKQADFVRALMEEIWEERP